MTALSFGLDVKWRNDIYLTQNLVSLDSEKDHDRMAAKYIEEFEASKGLQKLSLDHLNDPQVKHIAIANPVTAPYGEAAIEVLRSLDLEKQLEKKLVYGEKHCPDQSIYRLQNCPNRIYG